MNFVFNDPNVCEKLQYFLSMKVCVCVFVFLWKECTGSMRMPEYTLFIVSEGQPEYFNEQIDQPRRDSYP